VTASLTRGRFIVLVGIDGSGKTTLLDAMSRAGVHTTSWHDLRAHDVPAMLAPDAPTAVKSRLTPLARSMFIGGHLVAQYEYLVRPTLEQGTDVVLDSYYYKLLAKERQLGLAHPSLEALCDELPRPDALILIDTPPETSWSRKKDALSSYEYFGPVPSEASYLRFQRGIAEALHTAALSMPSVLLDGCTEPDDLLLDALGAVAALHEQKQAS
jgi:thymidylate kinase